MPIEHDPLSAALAPPLAAEPAPIVVPRAPWPFPEKIDANFTPAAPGPRTYNSRIY